MSRLFSSFCLATPAISLQTFQTFSPASNQPLFSSNFKTVFASSFDFLSIEFNHLLIQSHSRNFQKLISLFHSSLSTCHTKLLAKCKFCCQFFSKHSNFESFQHIWICGKMSKHFDFEKQIYAKINGSHLLPHSKPDQTEAEERILKLGTPEDAAQKQKLKILQQSTSK